MTEYYEKFIEDVTNQLRLTGNREKELRRICKLYGVDWKLEYEAEPK